MKTNIETAVRTPWNKGKLTGQKAPLRLHEIYARSRCSLSTKG